MNRVQKIIRSLLENRTPRPAGYVSTRVLRGDDDFEVTVPYFVTDRAEPAERDRGGSMVHPGYGALVELGQPVDAAGRAVTLLPSEEDDLYELATQEANGA